MIYNSDTMKGIFSFKPTNAQAQAADFLANPHLFLSGPASSGKTGAALLRLQQILTSSPAAPGSSTLVLVPQRSLAQAYQEYLQKVKLPASQFVSVQTMSSVVRRMIALFWPLIASRQVFRHPFEPPRFLTLETAQYYMAQIVDPLIDHGHFATITLTRNRLFSQLLDNLNKSAIVGFPHTELARRLKSAWNGDQAQMIVYDDVQLAVNAFRNFCLEHNLLDFSLQVELFRDIVWPNDTFQKYFQNQYQHLIYDNAEEDPPYVHDIVGSWIKNLQSSLIILDEGGGLRSFLGADPVSAAKLASQSNARLHFEKNYVSPAPIEALLGYMQSSQALKLPHSTISQALIIASKRPRFFPELLQSVSREIADLVLNGTPADQIVVLSPFVSDPMVFELSRRLTKAGLTTQTLRPSLALKSNPHIQTILTLASLAHPDWKQAPDLYQTQSALSTAIPKFDPLRARLILEQATINQDGTLLPPIETLLKELTERVPSDVLRQYKQLCLWIGSVDPNEPLDYFISRLFSELLTQPGFGFADDQPAGENTARLIQSYQKFKRPLAADQGADASYLGREYYKALSQGLLSALFVPEEEIVGEPGVLIAPVMTFLMQNRAVEHQFWLNLGSKGWYERLEQPLTHPYVLNRQFQPGKKWTTDDEMALGRFNLERTLVGLLRRCSGQVHLCTSDYGEAGIEEKGLLLTWAQNLFRSALREQKYG
ncbi:MAG TPA: DEAD/DEAH box helicase [Anaerolineaceae bacterium]|nr:DEAD/DEAH box helicase [Anaerolineaceae bacterium]